MGPADLEKVLSGLPKPKDDGRILRSWEGGEDAALWKITDSRVGILTLDFITPVCDDPVQWGEIAAANSVSDVFAMGGQPIVALNIVAFPLNCMPLEALQEILIGGAKVIEHSGAFLMGGHSIEDKEPKYGLAVFGEVEIDAMWRTSGARPGDVLILTKPLGSGIIATAIKADMIEPEDMKSGIDNMRKVNDLPRFMDYSMRKSIHAATDVTGFGLTGHVLDMLSGGGVDLRLDLASLPVMDGAVDLASQGLLPAGAYRNRNLYAPRVFGLGEDMGTSGLEDFLFDPQTSGGLLLACPPELACDVVELARSKGFVHSAVIGCFTEGDGVIRVV